MSQKSSAQKAGCLGFKLFVEPILVLLLNIARVDDVGDRNLLRRLGVLEDLLDGLQQLLQVGGGAGKRFLLCHSIEVGNKSGFGKHFAGWLLMICSDGELLIE